MDDDTGDASPRIPSSVPDQSMKEFLKDPHLVSGGKRYPVKIRGSLLIKLQDGDSNITQSFWGYFKKLEEKKLGDNIISILLLLNEKETKVLGQAIVKPRF
jgi:hypothetical protein